MGTVLRLVGGGWALLGVMAMCSGASRDDPTATGMSFLITMLLFVLPGLVVAGIGSLVAKRKGAP